MFKSDTLTTLNNLKYHITAGCLSKIPPGAGTNKNERLHEHIKSFFRRSRVGILLAYALLTMIFHAHNTSTRTGGKLSVRPLKGISSATKVKPIGIIPKERSRQQCMESSDHWEIDVSTTIMDMGQILPIYCRSLQKLEVRTELVKMKLTQLTHIVKHFQEFQTSKVSSIDEVNDTHLLNRLSEYGLTFSPTIPDGNCFFQAVSMNIMSDLDKWKDRLATFDIFSNQTMDLETLSMMFRSVFVQEVTGDHRYMYESFVPQNGLEFDFVREANTFLENGVYNTSIGDLMPLAIATALQASLVIITSNSQMPHMYVVPMVGTVEGSIFLIYNPTGAGHYDAALPYANITRPTTTTDKTIPVELSSI